MSTERFTLPVAVFLVITKDNKILLTRRANTNWHDGDYDLPAGHIDGKESMTTAVCREALEEVGIHIKPSDVHFKSVLHGYFEEDDTEYIYAIFRIDAWEGTPRIVEPDKCDDLQWFAPNALPKNITPGTATGLRAYLSDTPYVEVGF